MSGQGHTASLIDTLQGWRELGRFTRSAARQLTTSLTVPTYKLLPILYVSAISSAHNETLRRAFVVYKNDKLHRGHGTLIPPTTILSATLAGRDGGVVTVSTQRNLVTYKYPNKVNDIQKFFWCNAVFYFVGSFSLYPV